MKTAIKDLKPNPNNPRAIDEASFNRLVEKIKRNPDGLTANRIVHKDGIIIAGNQRFRALQKLDLDFKEEWFKDVSGWTDEQVREYLVTSNISDGTWDWDLLGAEYELPELEDWGLELPEYLQDTGEIVEDEVPEVSDEPPVSKLGEIYRLGRHRVMCGDSTDAENVEMLMDGVKTDMVFTDPPYGNADAGHYGRGELGHRHIIGDDSFDTFKSFIELNISNTLIFFLQWRTLLDAMNSLNENKYAIKTVAVWDKKNASLGQGLAEQWEAVIFSGDIKYTKFGGNVFSISREYSTRENSSHPHIKPQELLKEIMDYLPHKIILDPFLGSGSTLIACEQTDRICYGMEISEQYTDVVRKRYWKYTHDNNEEGWEEGTPSVT